MKKLETDCDDIRKITPEQQLWKYCLMQSLHLVARKCYSKKSIKEQRETIRWFFSDDYYIGSFKWIIDALGLSREAIKIIRESLKPRYRQLVLNKDLEVEYDYYLLHWENRRTKAGSEKI